ncbi:MAG: hypothetical protein HOV81_01535 [Kofleriaceae bacterium]|nr:hypothetical protein [Kofleriaceae bacterium]
MKLLAVTQEHAKKPVVRVTWGAEAVFFAGEQPPIPSMLALELPGLKVASQTGLHEWLEARGETALGAELWRLAVLDDLLDAHNGGDMHWQIAQHFTLAQIAAFSEAHGPGLLAETKAALAAERAKRASALRELAKRTSRIVPVIYASTTRVALERIAVEIEEDHTEIAKLEAGPFDADRWIDVCSRLNNDQVRRETLGTIGRKLVQTGGDIPDALQRMRRRGLATVWSDQLWQEIKDHVVLDQNVSGEAIDLTKATEVTVTASWETWKARRVGPIKIGRAALAITVGNETTYVRGERKLLHRIRARGGKLERWGNTLVVGGKKGPASAHEKLLEVDRIDTLAQVDPAAAARLAGDLAATDPIAGALERARTEPTWRRILADLLIERLVGIDADVARRLARAQARANRR